MERLDNKDYQWAADALDCDVPAIKAVAKVESSGSGFLRDGRPKILFESRWFNVFTEGKYNYSHPHISTKSWVRNYYGGAREYNRLNEAAKLDRIAALKATSWGMFQIMGFHYRDIGWPYIVEFVKDMETSHFFHLKAFVGFIKANNLDNDLRDHRWTRFALKYNGPGYKKNRYDIKMENAYNVFKRKRKGIPVLDIQRALNRFGYDVAEDNTWGWETMSAVIKFQYAYSLVPDGIVGPMTRRKLGI